MSVFPLLLSLSVASAAMWISFEIREEIVRLFARVIALLSLFLALSFTPWFILLLFIALLLGFKIPHHKKYSEK